MLHRYSATIIALVVFASTSVFGRDYIEAIYFQPIPTGATATLEVKISGIIGQGQFVIVDSTIGPYTIVSTPLEHSTRNGYVVVRVTFHPLTPGEFRDEIILERRPPIAPENDRIVVRLYGTAFRLEREDKVNFGTVLTADTSRRTVFVRNFRGSDVRWTIAKPPKPPFDVVTKNGPILMGGDTLAFVFSFSPRTVGSHIDSVGLVRVDKNGNSLDTVLAVFFGQGVGLPAEASAVFDPISVGMTLRDTVTIDLPVSARLASFTYDATVADPGVPISAVVLGNGQADRNNRVFVEITCSPSTYKSQRALLHLSRKLAGKEIVDKTTISVGIVMVPRPVSLSASFRADTLFHRIGDTVLLDVFANTTDTYDEPLLVSGLTLRLTYNPTLLVALPQAGQTVDVGEDDYGIRHTLSDLPNPIALDGPSTVVATIPFVVTLGDAESTQLKLENFELVVGQDKHIRVQPTTSVLMVTNVWRYGNGMPRFINPLAGTLILDIDPNPVVSTSTIRVRNLSTQGGKLIVLDALGRVRADLSAGLQSGKKEFSVASSGTADVVVSAGTYYARLLEIGAQPNDINSVVRVFVVQ